MIILKEPFEFEWDKGDIDKNEIKHRVQNKESEEIFFDSNKKIIKSRKLYFKDEYRYILIGKTKKERLLYIVFTKRGRKLRIISARDINKKEKYLYEKRT